MKGKAILAVTALIAIGVTILIYNVAVTEWTSSLKLAAGVVCLSEVAILCTLGLLPEVNFKNGATGIMIQVYAALMVLWSLIGPQFEKASTFHIGLLVISLVMLALIGIATFGSHETDRLNQETEKVLDQKRNFAVQRPTYIPSSANPTSAATSATSTVSSPKPRTDSESLPAMWLEMQANIEDDDLLKKVRVLVERIQAMPASRFPNATIEQGMRELTAMSRALANPEAKERVEARMANKMKEMSNYIKTL